MANVRYAYGNQLFLEAGINWLTAPIKCVLIGTSVYSYSPVHQHLSDIPVAARIATSGTLASRTTTLGVADAADVIFPAVPAGLPVNAVVIFSDSGTASTSPLIAFMDSAPGLPINPDGSNIQLSWDNGAHRVFVL